MDEDDDGHDGQPLKGYGKSDHFTEEPDCSAILFWVI